MDQLEDDYICSWFMKLIHKEPIGHNVAYYAKKMKICTRTI